MAINKNNPVPFKAVHPGYGLREELKARGLKQREFAKMIGVQPSHLNELIQGKRDISNAIASKLESSLGIPATSWLNLQYMYEYQNKAIEQRSAKEQEAKSETMAKAIDSLRAYQSGNPKMEKIIKVWFRNDRIFIRTSKENIYSRSLKAFPLLMDATPSQRARYEIGLEGDDLYWEEIDEDIHISSFYEKEELVSDDENEIAKVFKRFPQLNVSEVARSMGINKSLLARYIYGVKRPSEKRKKEIFNALRKLGKELAKL